MVSILKTNLMTQWIDLWFGREHPLLKRRESAPVRDLLDEDDDSDEEEDDYVWFTGIDHALVSRASILESEICVAESRWQKDLPYLTTLCAL